MIVYLLVYINTHDKIIECYRSGDNVAFEDLAGKDAHASFDILGKAGWQMCGVDNKDSEIKGITAYWFSKTAVR